MTTIPTKSCKEPGSNTAFPAGPWTGRTLDQSETIVSQYAMAYERKRTAEAEFKQAEASLKHAHSEGLLEGHFDDLSETYEFKGVRFSKASRQSQSCPQNSKIMTIVRNIAQARHTASQSQYADRN